MVDASAYDWTQFDLYYYYHAPVEKVWQTWATPEGLCTFFVESCSGFDEQGKKLEPSQAFVAGCSYEWKWRQGFPGNGRFLKVTPEKHIAFSFGASMRVDVYFLDIGSGVRVHLHQSNIPDSPEGRVIGHLNCRSCWIFFMTNLLSVLDGGLDLRDRDEARVSSMEVGFSPPENLN